MNKQRSRNNLLALGCFVALFMAAFSFKAEAKSLVLVLNSGTKVYYKITTAAPPRMVIGEDGTFSVNSQDYIISDVKNFVISDTDYSGEQGTTDGIVSIDEKGILMQGDVSIYTLDGKLLRKGSRLADMPKGIYVISNGVSTLKIQKQ